MKSVFRNVAVGSLKAGLKATGERGRRLMAEAMSSGGEPMFETVETVATPRGELSFYCLGDTSLWRARTLFTKEPETIEWIDGFSDGETLWDIGANVGIYSLYAAGRGVNVLAFEPSAPNYFLLNRNIEINRMSERVRAYCLAFARGTGLEALNMQTTTPGGALSSFGTMTDQFGKEFTAQFRQGMIGYSLDEFIAKFSPPFPDHIKIDVDGIEDEIVAGAAATLRDARLKSVSIEIDAARADYTARITDAMSAGGLVLDAKRQGQMFEGGEYGEMFNFQFRRKAG